MNMSENISDLAIALSKFQGEVSNPIKNLINPAYKSKYADFTQIMKTIKIPLFNNGISVIQNCGGDEKEIYVQTLILHNSGQYIKSDKLSIVNKKEVLYTEKIINKNGKYINMINGKEIVMYTIQDIGGILTYLKRYQLSTMLAIPSDDDDDGNNVIKDQVQEYDYKNHNKQNEKQNDDQTTATKAYLSIISRIADAKKIDKENLIILSEKTLGKKSTKEMSTNELQKFIEVLKGE